MRWPAKLPKGKDVHQMAITMDLTATFAAVAGASPPSGYRFDGMNLLPVLTGESASVEDRTFCWRIDRSNRKMRAVRHGHWKYLDDGGTMDLLFDLSEDVGERRNVGRMHPEIVRDLKKRLAAWEEEIGREKRTFVVR
jgi:arylsulfatase A-like enzyme